MRKREYRCVNGKIHVLESPRILVSNSEYDAFGLQYDTVTEAWVKVPFDTATDASRWVDDNEDTNVYRIPISMEGQAIHKEFELYKNFSMSKRFPDFGGLSDDDLLKAEPNIFGMSGFIKALEDSNEIAKAQIEEVSIRLKILKAQRSNQQDSEVAE